MTIDFPSNSIAVGDSRFHIRRTTGGVPAIHATDRGSLACGIGFSHAHDRLAQMVAFRHLGQGRLSEWVKSGEAELRADIFARTMGFSRYAQLECSSLPSDVRDWAKAYCRGVNHRIAHGSLPIEYRLRRYRPDPWTTGDTLLILKMMTYFLGHFQREMEKLIVQAICAGVSIDKLQQLFRPHLDGLTEDIIQYVKQVSLSTPTIPAHFWPPFTPQHMSSNNWVISGMHTVSGFPIECHDPHLPCNYLPPIWYELITQMGDDYGIGASIPGIPGFVMGRNRELSMGFTYGYMDMMDYFVEECRGGKFRQGAEWRDFDRRSETILRRGKSPIDITIRANERGTLECDPFQATIADGYYLNFAWSARDQGAAQLLAVLARSREIHSVTQAQSLLRNATISANWLLADRAGNIGYQQSGLLPRRPHSGLYPLPGWEDSSAWMEFVDPQQFATDINPSSGFLATANDGDSHHGRPGVNLSMGPYRHERLNELFRNTSQCSLCDMEIWQHDLYSQQADRYMRIIRPLLPAHLPLSDVLRDWDLRYDAQSKGATLFEAVYDELLRVVFGERLLGEAVWSTIVNETALFANYFYYFDQILLMPVGSSEESEWFGNEGRDALIRHVLCRVLESHRVDRLDPWRRRTTFTFRSGLLPKILSKVLGLDRLVTIEGSRASVSQCSRVRTHGWQLAVAPSYRYITDLGTDSARTSLAGGPSDRVHSRLFASELVSWFDGKYKTLVPDDAPTDAGPG